MWVLEKCSKYSDGAIYMYNLNKSIKSDENNYLQALQKK